MFKSVRPNMKGIDVISEADPDFEKKADSRIKKAVEIANKSGAKSSDDVARELGASTEIKAKYKIEVRFMKGRTTNGPNLCGVTVWESGKRLHGGGDDKMYFCKDVRPESDLGCWGPITSDYIRNGVAYCPRCKAAVNAQYLTDCRVYRLPTRTLAAQIEKIFRTLDSSADIYLKYDRDDIHFKAMERTRGWDVAKKLRGLHIYPLRNILKDTSAGADLAHRIYIFLTS